MRYIVFVIIGVLSVVLSGTVFSVINIAGICIDLLLLCILSILLREKTAMAIGFAVVFGIMYDILYSGVLGLNAFAYAVTAAVIYAVLRKKSNVNFLNIFCVGLIGYILKELIMAVCVSFMGADFSMLYMLRRYILPGSALMALLLFPSYYLMGRLYVNSWMLPNSTSDNEDIKNI